MNLRNKISTPRRLSRDEQAALDSARYVDDEVEGLLNVNGGARFELDCFLSPPPELMDGWWGDSSTTTGMPRSTKGVPTRPTPPNGTRASSRRLMDTARAVVSNTSTLSNAVGGHTVETKKETDLDSTRLGRGSETHVGVTEDPSMKANDNVREEGGSGRGSARAGEKGLAQAWGLKDPSVARAMIKRAKRMRKFQNGEARREKMKNPDVRFDAFAKNAGEHGAARRAALSETGSAVRSLQQEAIILRQEYPLARFRTPCLPMPPRLDFPTDAPGNIWPPPLTFCPTCAFPIFASARRDLVHPGMIMAAD